MGCSKNGLFIVIRVAVTLLPQCVACRPDYAPARRGKAVQSDVLLVRARHTSHGYSGIVVYDETARKLIVHDENYRCDLIIIGKHAAPVTEKLLLGRVTKRILAKKWRLEQ
jgi:hypothetical protein